ncbi:RNA polymerase subunit sigma-70 [Streptomyces sp. NPDC059788]|uniref:RNA polymerase subunit sigma-70 n=1 Tax=Streptomyces sp. NPDC059788 TaxID=3346948 RepID=UPI0036577497
MGTRGRGTGGPHGVDEQAQDAVLEGDEEAFARLAERYRHELRVHCYRLLGSFTDAEDLVQEALLRAWRKRRSFEARGGATFRAWLYRIATNACLDALASPARSREIAVAVDSAGAPTRSAPAEVTWLQPYPDALLDRAAPADGGPEAAVIARETVELAFLAAIQHLPPRQRAVLILRDIVGLPAAETAGTLELSVAAVKSALQRARATLREHLPERRADWGRGATGPSEAERALLQRFVAASQAADVAALTALLREDARQTMPPAHLVFDGRAAIIGMWRAALEGDRAWGDWHAVPLSANRQPAVANYVRLPGAPSYTAVNIDVLRIEDGRIAEITTFAPDVLPAFGLPATVAPADVRG